MRDRPAYPPSRLPPEGNLLFREFKIGDTTVEFLGEVGVQGKHLTLADISVFPKGADAVNQLGPSAVRSLFGNLGREAKALGFDTLRITGTRATGPNIGKRIDTMIDLSKF